MWQVYALLGAFFASLTAIFAKIGLKGIDSNLATAIRTTVILLITWGVVMIGGSFKQIREISKTGLIFLVLSGIATGLSWLFYFKALQIGDASKVAPVDKLSLALTILLSILILGEPATPKVIIGGLLVVAGVIVVAL